MKGDFNEPNDTDFMNHILKSFKYIYERLRVVRKAS